VSERPTFSPMWSRVRALRPRLRSHTQITRQHYRGRRWHVVHDPASNQFYRLTPMAHELVCLLDGRRTVDEAWRLCMERHGDEAPTQVEAVELLSQLYNANLLAADDSPETEQLLRRGRKRLERKTIQQAMGIMYFKMRLFNPDGIFTALEPIFRPILSRAGLVLWFVLMASAGFALAGELGALFDSERFQGAIAPANWPWLIVIFIISKIIHESGHGLICKRFGGQVPELGVMLLVLFPAPFVDASSCWAFPSKWQRLLVASGGMLFELAIAALAAFAWLATLDTGGLTNQLAYSTMLTTSISTMLFNANPLMRFDGYYILSDLLEAPNLMQRAQNLIKFHFQKLLYRNKNAKPPAIQPGEGPLLVIYGWAALAYRVFLFFTITLFVMGQMFGLGLVLAIWTAAAWFLIPTGKWIHWLATSPHLADHRTRAVLTSIAAVALVAGLVGLVPVPDNRRADAVVESAAQSGVFAGAAGFITQVHVAPGQRVTAGQPIATADNPQLRSELLQASASKAELEARFRQAMAQGTPIGELMAQRRAVINQRLAFLRERVDALTIRAPHDGVVADDPRRFAGSYVQQGEPICTVLAPRDIHVVASLDQAQADWLDAMRFGEHYQAAIRRPTRPERVHPVTDLTRRRAGDRVLPHPALADVGGGQILTDRSNQNARGQLAKQSRFTVEIDADFSKAHPPPLPGERVVVRFSLPPRPLLGQWVDHLRRLVQGRVDL